MKARIRNTNIEVDVQPFYDETGYFAGFKDGYEYYRAADLIFPDTPDWDKTDWSSFRREAANAAMSGMMANADFWQSVWSENRVKGRCDYPSEIAHFAIACADELIKQLKQE